jgi:hypothetical protein
VLRRHDADHTFGSFEGGCEVIGGFNCGGQGDARQKTMIDTLPGDAFADISFIRPEPDPVVRLACQHEG